MLLILVVAGLAIFGMIRFTRTLAPGERAVAWIVFIVVVAVLGMKLTHAGIFGRATG